MKIKITIISIALVIVGSFFCYADYDRVNVQMPIMRSEPISTLDKATGWMFNDLGQWESGDNYIPAYSYDNFDNFIKLFLSEITIGNDTYYTLIKLKSENEMGFLSYCIFEKNELTKFNFNNKAEPKLFSINLVYTNILLFGLLNEGNTNYNYISNEIIESVQKARLKESDYVPKNYANYTLNFNILPLKNKPVVRFIMMIVNDLPRINPNFKDIPGGINTALSSDIFNRCYYEVDFDTFNNFIPLTQEKNN